MNHSHHKVTSRCAATILLALLLVPSQASGQIVPDRDTLLLMHFDGSVRADYAVGDPGVNTLAASTGSTGGRFGGGVQMHENDSIEFVGNDGNFNPSEGTIEFWVQTAWPGDDTETHSFVSCPMGDNQYININSLGNGRLGIAISAGKGDDWGWRRADGDISQWKAETWHHVAFAWGDGVLEVFVDGKLGVRSASDAKPLADYPERIVIQGSDSIIDGFRILGRRFRVEDVQRSIAHSLNPPYRYASDLPWTASTAAWADGRKILGGVNIPLMLASQQYAKGFACPPETVISIPLEQGLTTFSALAGVCPLSPPDSSCTFVVMGDASELFHSGPRTSEQEPLQLSVPVGGVRRLQLLVRSTGTQPGPVHAVWAGAALLRQADADVVVQSRELSDSLIDMYRRQQNADSFLFPVDETRRMMVVPKHWEDEIDPVTAPPLSSIKRPLSLCTTPGEYEAANFVVYAFDTLRDVSITVDNLQSGSNEILGNVVDVRLVLRRLMRDVYTLPPERSTVVSRFLLPQQATDIPTGTFREFHLTFHVPKDTLPGRYEGVVRIGTAGHDDVRIPVTCEVLPFRLDTPRDRHYGVYYRFPSAAEDWKDLDIQLADIREHGGNMLKCNLGVDFRIDDGALVASYDTLRSGLRLLRKHGFHGPLPVGSGCEQAVRLLGYDPVLDHTDSAARERFQSAVTDAMQGLVALNAEFPEFELLATHMDEIFGRDRLERYIQLTEAVRSTPGLRVYITLHNDPKRDTSESMRRCDPYVDVRCYNGHALDNWIRAGNTFDDLAAELEQAGDEGWIYHNIRGAFFPAEWTRLVNGYYLWISPLRAHVPWIYYSFKGSPYDCTDGPRLRGGDFAYAVPDPTDPTRMVPTRHWEAFREGIDDMRYLATVQSLAAQQPATPATDAAQRWLEQLRRELTPTASDLEPIETESPVLVWLSRKLDGDRYRQIRRQAAEHISRLGAAGSR